MRWIGRAGGSGARRSGRGGSEPSRFWRRGSPHLTAAVLLLVPLSNARAAPVSTQSLFVAPVDVIQTDCDAARIEPCGIVPSPFDAAVDSGGHRLYVTGAPHVAVIDTELHRVVGRIDAHANSLGAGIAVDPARNRLFVVEDQLGVVSIVD